MKSPELRCCCSFAGSCAVSVVVALSIVLVITSTHCVEGFESGLQLPRSGFLNGRVKSNRVLFIHDFGAAGDGVGNDTQALKDCWEVACSSPKRPRIVVPAGTYLVHPIVLSGPCKSKITFSIYGTIVAPQDPDAWRGLNRRRWLYFSKINHLSVDGGGTINGMGEQWWANSCKTNKTNPCRTAPTALTFHRCKDLKVTDLRVVDGQQMHMTMTNCVRVSLSQIAVMAPASSPNTDGIHISSSRGINVMNTTIGTGDDCISIVGHSSRINIKDIACGPGHGISIGSLGKSNSTASVKSVSVDGAFLSNTQNGLRIKTWQGGSGEASDINFQNVLMENVSNPIIINQFYCDSKIPCANQTKGVKVKNISFKHIEGTSATKEAMRFSCSEYTSCEGLYLEDVHLVLSSGEGFAESFCWEAYGTSGGSVFPPPCFSSDHKQLFVIKQEVPNEQQFIDSM
ncbi:unnamed protein product [Linum tenue]|uniref:endo-polygalacturonase n=1 Tax=Linum tenue TaxID=586396 RepID=A0AAV0QA16_9ROSI|nr:unnamed protein product [Linum tenue]